MKRSAVRLGLAAACIALAVAPAPAAVYVVDGACATSGAGTSLACGASGPFRTVNEGLEAMQSGDTLNVRGAHDGFDGVYFEQMNLTNTSSLGGRALACTASERCTIQGCPAGTCPADEVPIIRGMRRRDDWTDEGGGVFSRVMELTPELASSGDENNARSGDPIMVMEGSADPFTMLGYAGDDVTAPADGHWSFHPASRRLYVNPTGGAHPRDVMQLPHYSYGLLAERPTANVTIRNLAFEGTRLIGMQLTGQPLTPVSGMIVSDVRIGYFPRHGLRTTVAVPDITIERVTVEHGCRGMSWALDTGDGCFGLRLFSIHGGIVRGNVVRHMGATGEMRYSNPAAMPWPCAWCDAPWNVRSHTYASSTGVGINVKQTENALVEDNVVEDLSFGAIYVDTTRTSTIRRNRTMRTAWGIRQSNYTPAPGFEESYDDLYQDNCVERSEGCAVSVEASPNRPAGVPLATIERTTVVQPQDATWMCASAGDGVTLSENEEAAACPAVSPTTTSVPPGGTTTTTLFPRARRERYLGGDRLVLRDRPDHPNARRFLLQSRDPTELVLGDDGDPAPLLASGATLRVIGIGGDGFDQSYPLEAGGWRPLDARNPRAGIRYRSTTGPITALVFRANAVLRIVGRGPGLTQPITPEPESIQVELRFGDFDYCLEFGGSIQRYAPGRRVVRKGAVRPLGCPG
jgi:hypothetical protein